MQGLKEFQTMLTREHEDGEGWSERVGEYIAYRFGGVVRNASGQLENSIRLVTPDKLAKWGISKTVDQINLEADYLDQFQVFPLGTNSWQRTVERITYPERNNTMITNDQLAGMGEMRLEDINPMVKGWYKSYNQHMAGHVLHSPDMPKAFNFWGEPLTAIQSKTIEEHGKQQWMFNPFRIQYGRYSKLDEEIIKINEMSGDMFNYHPKRLSINLNTNPMGKANTNIYQLTADEYNRFVYVTNNIDSQKRIKPNPELGIDGHPGYDESTNMINALNDRAFGGRDDKYSLANYEDRMKYLKSIISDYRGMAKDWSFKNEYRLISMTDVDRLVK
jgi:hypothetical protein